MISPQNVICAEMLIAKYFTDNEKTEGASEIIAWVKQETRGLGVRKTEIREARKRRGIESVETDQGRVWVWKNPLSPEEMWKSKSKELLEW